ncbi:heparan-alpha-glucosaminide N-acetyltransferase domain-containing protein [Roseobacter ponti]|uniref:DUF1624 domain-containing protein n=1 Tax=Roseobacter ponti TaxID=1891787 RepID=A0A858SVX0_9RHOB|nr:heparan-alpha-glucosaminide N-acetyltransferase domain-containing protein [Roseobacter ponti]QJF51631.1 DUF1624 domain-containing protein [Roseobacter ponti]
MADLDIARSLALFGIIVFHTARDPAHFGVLEQGTTLCGTREALARLVAGSFFVIAGAGLVLAHD